jgi:uncharacterized membrane protein
MEPNDTLQSTSVDFVTVKAEFSTFNLVLAIYTILMFIIGVTIIFFYNSHNEFMMVFMLFSTIMTIAGFILLFVSNKKSDCNMWVEPDVLIAKIIAGINSALSILIVVLGFWMLWQGKDQQSLPLGGMSTISILVIIFILLSIPTNTFTLCHITDPNISTTYWLNVSISCMLLVIVYISFRDFYGIDINRTQLVTVNKATILS